LRVACAETADLAVEAPEAAEARREGHLAEGEAGLVDELLREVRVVVTPTKKRPSKRASRARRARLLAGRRLDRAVPPA